MKRVPKPWGEELWVVHNEHYALKIITIRAGCRTSLQFHNQKHEANYVDFGKVKTTLQDENGKSDVQIMGPGAVVEIAPGRQHRIEALKDTRLIEVSTSHLDDVVRVEDDYGR
ncbi:MAG: cupin [Dehalococcoidia bacterium]